MYVPHDTGTVVGKMTTFFLWPIPLGGGAWGAGTNMWHPETPASYESLPAPLATQIPTLWIHSPWGRGRGGGALILDRCRAFGLFASVDAHLCTGNEKKRSEYLRDNMRILLLGTEGNWYEEEKKLLSKLATMSLFGQAPLECFHVGWHDTVF